MTVLPACSAYPRYHAARARSFSKVSASGCSGIISRSRFEFISVVLVVATLPFGNNRATEGRGHIKLPVEPPAAFHASPSDRRPDHLPERCKWHSGCGQTAVRETLVT